MGFIRSIKGSIWGKLQVLGKKFNIEKFMDRFVYSGGLGTDMKDFVSFTINIEGLNKKDLKAGQKVEIRTEAQ